MALGTDTGGSVRAPASHCGLVGLRPTHGRVSLQGALDLSPSFDTCGWFTRELTTFARVADLLLGTDPAPLPAAPRLLRPTDLWDLLTPEVLDAFAAPCARVETALGAAAPVTVVLDSLEAMYWHYRHVQGHEAWTVDGALITRYEPPLGPGVAERFAWARLIPDTKLAAGQAYRARFCAHMAEILGTDGVLLMPTMPDIAPLISDDEAGLESYRNRALQMLCVAGLAGLPQLSLPWATRLGAPLGLSLVGPPGSDRSLVALAQRIAG
jgi:amidase